jgi:hypothetical protein
MQNGLASEQGQATHHIQRSVNHVQAHAPELAPHTHNMGESILGPADHVTPW